MIKGSLDYLNVIQTKKKVVLLRTDYCKVLLGAKNAEKKITFGNFTLKSV